MVPEPTRVNVNSNLPIKFRAKLSNLGVNIVSREPLNEKSRQATLSQLSFNILMNGFRNPHGPNALLRESTKVIIGRKKVFNLSFRKGNALSFKPNMLVFGSILKRSVYNNTVGPREFETSLSKSSKSANEEGDLGPIPGKPGRPQVKNMLNDLVSKNRSKRSAHNGFVTFKKVLSIGRRDDFRVNMGSEDSSLPSSMAHINNLTWVSKRNRSLSKLMEPNLEVNLTIRKSLDLFKEGN